LNRPRRSDLPRAMAVSAMLWRGLWRGLLFAIAAICTVSCVHDPPSDEFGTSAGCMQEGSRTDLPSGDDLALLQRSLLRFGGLKNFEQEEETKAWSSSVESLVEEELRKGDSVQCDLCRQDWVIILATGRSGSTSVLQMLNALPGFFVAGEHAGTINDLMHVWRNIFRNKGAPLGWPSKDPLVGFKSDTQSIGPWFHAEHSEMKVLCTLQSAAQLLLGEVDTSTYSTLGFKEIRYASPDILDFLTRLFPCARFIVNVRKNIEAQASSAFWNRTTYDDAVKTLETETRNLREWQAKDASKRFLLELESFSPDLFNRMLAWLGVTGCRYMQVAHVNDRGSYDHIASEAVISGSCSKSKSTFEAQALQASPSKP